MAWLLDGSVEEDEFERSMKKTGNSWLKVMFGIAKFFASQENNSGRTLVVSFQRLPLVLGVQDCGTRKSS